MKKRAITLVEIMIVIVIIGLIGSVIGYNMKGSLDEGKAFKSEQGSKQVYDYLTMQIAQKQDSFNYVLEHPEKVLEQSGFISRANKLIQDGWNQKFIIEKIEEADGNGPDFVVFSQNWYNFLKNKKNMSNQEMQEEYPWAFYFGKEDPREEE